MFSLIHIGNKEATIDASDEFWFLPFFTILNILRRMEPNDIISHINASEFVKRTYRHINNSSIYKFVFHSRIDKCFSTGIKAYRIKHVYVDMNQLDSSLPTMNLWTLLDFQTQVETLTIIDQPFFPYKSPPILLRQRLENLTKVEIFGSHREHEMHSISPLLRVARNIKELTYTNGNLDGYGLKSVKNLNKLKLNNVNIGSISEFLKLLHRSRDSLEILHFDYLSCCISMSRINIIRHSYDGLLLLNVLKDVKLPGGNSLCRHHNLEISPRLSKLTIYMAKHMYIYPLFVILKRIIVDEMIIEFRECPHNVSPVPDFIEDTKRRYLEHIQAHQTNLKIKYISAFCSNN